MKSANQLTTSEAVRAYYEAPHEMALRKEMKRIDQHCRQFIAASPFLVIASADASGRADATPRGDAPGFVVVLDETTLLIPDRRGNNRVDTMINISQNPHVGLLFLVPSVRETLRVNGRANITIDTNVLAPLAAHGKIPRAAIKVEVEEVYFQCGKALVRSELWNPAHRARAATLTPFGQVLADQCEVGYDPQLDQILEADYREGTY